MTDPHLPTGWAAVDGEDLSGLASLALLTPLPADATVLFLGHRAASARAQGGLAVLSIGELNDPRELPYDDASFDSAVIDADSLPHHAIRGGADTARVLEDVWRVLKPGGGCIVVTATSRLPQNLLDWRSYRLQPPAKAWATSVSTSPFQPTRSVMIRRQGPRITDVDLRGPAAGRAGSVTGLVLRKFPTAAPGAIDAILQALSATLGYGQIPGTLQVRKIGKTVIVSPPIHGRRIVTRIPTSSAALRRARVNHAAVSRIHGSPLAPGWKRLVPHPLAEGVHGGQAYFVEELVAGASRGDTDAAAPNRERQAIRFITELHRATAERVTIDRGHHGRLVENPVATVAGLEGATGLTPVEAFIRRSLLQRSLPLVWCHGDFAIGNCLYDDEGRLSGVIDWELFATGGLPLLDALHRLDVPGETSSHPTWQRFDLIMALLGRPGWRRTPAVADYVEALKIDPAAVPGLLLMHWLHHVSHRIGARGRDPVWVRKRVLDPLQRLSRWLQDSRSQD